MVSKVVLFKNCEWPHGGKTSHAPKVVKDMKSNIQTQTKTFLGDEFDWHRPHHGIAGGEQRTLHLVLPQRYRKALRGKHNDDRKLNELRSKTGCKIYITWERTDGKMQLVTIIGPKEKLTAAEKEVKTLV